MGQIGQGLNAEFSNVPLKIKGVGIHGRDDGSKGNMLRTGSNIDGKVT